MNQKTENSNVKMKSCKQCKNYIISRQWCAKNKMNVHDTLAATYCKSFYDKKKYSGEGKCSKCRRINKYGFCYAKKICIKEEDRNVLRKCRSYTARTAHIPKTKRLANANTSKNNR